MTQGHDSTLGIVEPQKTGSNPWIQPVLISLQNLLPFQQITTPTQLGVISKLTEAALYPLIQVIIEYIKQVWPQY